MPEDLSNNQEYTLKSAKLVPGAFVYGLKDEAGIFYVGQTKSAHSRFAMGWRGYSFNPNVMRRMSKAGDALRVVILEMGPTDLTRAENRHIRRLGLDLANFNSSNSRHQTKNARLMAAHTLGFIPACHVCGAEADIEKSRKYCRSCLVARGKDTEQSKQRLRELSKSATAAYSSSEG